MLTPAVRARWALLDRVASEGRCSAEMQGEVCGEPAGSIWLACRGQGRRCVAVCGRHLFLAPPSEGWRPATPEEAQVWAVMSA